MYAKSQDEKREEAKQLVYEQLKSMASDLEHQFPRKWHVCWDYREAGDFLFFAIIPSEFDHNRGWMPVYEDAISMNDREKINKAITFMEGLTNA